MTEPRHESDFAINAQLVRTLLAAQFPALHIESIEFLGEGWDSAAYLIHSTGANSACVFRFPKRRERQAWVESEIAALQLMASQEPSPPLSKGGQGGALPIPNDALASTTETNPLPIRIPVPEYIGKPCSLFPCSFMGYQLLSGTPGDRIETSRVEKHESARRLGELLTAVHTIDPQEAAARGVLPYDSPLPDVLAETTTMRDIVSSHLPADLAALCRPFLEGTCAIPETPNRPPCVVHGDLVDEHILLDSAGHLTGVIDWGDSCLGDPSIDFAGLYAWLGEDFVRNVLAHYTNPYDQSFLDQIAFRARCLALTTLGYSLQGRDTSQANRLPLVHTAFGVERH